MISVVGKHGMLFINTSSRVSQILRTRRKIAFFRSSFRRSSDQQRLYLKLELHQENENFLPMLYIQAVISVIGGKDAIITNKFTKAATTIYTSVAFVMRALIGEVGD